jgi:tetratricopeptide (TPR) repeat protein
MAKQSRSRVASANRPGSSSRAPGAKAPAPAKAKAVKKPAAKEKAKAKPPVTVDPVPAQAARNLAVEIFEKGFQALQHRQYGKARDLLSGLVTSYPDEKELHERARVYLAICERQAATSAEPRTFEERLCAATMAINKGWYQNGLEMLQALERDHAEHDHVQYLLAIAHAARGNTPTAIAHLKRAIELRPANRLQATQDADLDVLRQDQAFLDLLETPPEPRTGRR